MSIIISFLPTILIHLLERFKAKKKDNNNSNQIFKVIRDLTFSLRIDFFSIKLNFFISSI
jgi:hypothetical protein